MTADLNSALAQSAAAETLANSAEVMAAVLAIAITVVAIVVELAANRYSHRVTTLFVREPVNIGVLILFVATTLACIWLGAEIGTSVIGPQVAFYGTMGLITLSMLVLLPYFAFVLSFISPLNIIRRIQAEGKRALNRPDNLDEARARLALSVDELQDVTRNAIEQSDRGIAIAAVTALCELLQDYQACRQKLPPGWFRVDGPVVHDPDFVSLEEEAIVSLNERGTWFELKVCRQLASILASASPRVRDLANVIAIRTRILGVSFADSDLLPLVITTLNSYLRATINARDPRTTYYILNQYRLLAEDLIARDRHSEVHAIAEHFRYYGQLAYHLEQPFLLEVTAYDLLRLIEVSQERHSPLTDELIDVLLDLDLSIRTETDEASLIGVRRAQMQLAVALLHDGENERAQKVVDDLQDEPLARLRQIANELEHEDRDHYWELTERGINFAYLNPELRPHLKTVLNMLEAGAHPANTSYPLT